MSVVIDASSTGLVVGGDSRKMADFAGLDQRGHIDVLRGGDRLARRKHQAVPVGRRVHHAHGALFWRFAVDAVNRRIRMPSARPQHPEMSVEPLPLVTMMWAPASVLICWPASVPGQQHRMAW